MSVVQSFIIESMCNELLDKKSASLLLQPRRYLMVKLKSAKAVTYLCPVAFNLAVDIMNVKGLLSV